MHRGWFYFFPIFARPAYSIHIGWSQWPELREVVDMNVTSRNLLRRRHRQPDCHRVKSNVNSAHTHPTHADSFSKNVAIEFAVQSISHVNLFKSIGIAGLLLLCVRRMTWICVNTHIIHLNNRKLMWKWGNVLPWQLIHSETHGMTFPASTAAHSVMSLSIRRHLLHLSFVLLRRRESWLSTNRAIANWHPTTQSAI